ncbi:hypothetical protein [Arthrobacter sp. NPDC058192]|uniref:hypothetical protein n=1 Tax=Arthrobacter sp. NPDC058192 TaxID=3346372 RepID=UPI0036ED6181
MTHPNVGPLTKDAAAGGQRLPLRQAADRVEESMAVIGNKAPAGLKDGALKLYALAKDPEVQARITELYKGAKELYETARSPEAKQAYRQAAEFVRKSRKK